MPGAKAEDAARQQQQQEPGMDTWEAFMLLLAVLAVLLLIGGLMVRPPARSSGCDLVSRCPQPIANFVDGLLTLFLP